jgi:hypothetical protein
VHVLDSPAREKQTTFIGPWLRNQASPARPWLVGVSPSTYGPSFIVRWRSLGRNERAIPNPDRWEGCLLKMAPCIEIVASEGESGLPVGHGRWQLASREAVVGLE